MSHPSKGNSTKVESLFEALFVCLKRFKWIMRTSGRLKRIIKVNLQRLNKIMANYYQVWNDFVKIT